MDDTQAAKVLRFTGKQKDTTEISPPVPPAPVPARTRPRASVWLTLLALTLATVAVNRFAYGPSAADPARAVASVSEHLERDAAWEKSLAERLAEPGVIQSRAAVGRRPNAGEALRFGLLEDRYRIEWRGGEDGRLIRTIAHAAQDPLAIDGAALVSQYGALFTPGFAEARRLSDTSAGQAFELVNKAGVVTARVTLAYDEGGRLISVSSTPVQM